MAFVLSYLIKQYRHDQKLFQNSVEKPAKT